MYGTVARFTIKPGMEQQLDAIGKEYDSLKIPGYVGEIIYKMDSSPNEYFMAVIFENKALYEKNADDPAQHQRYLKWRALLAADPEWHDGEIVFKRP